MSWVTFGSPLWKKDTVQTTIKSLPSIDEARRMEQGFVNDAVKTHKYHKSRRSNIIPCYDARNDKFAMSYFKSPLTQAIIDRTLAMKVSKIFQITFSASSYRPYTSNEGNQYTSNHL